jgi:hypothetical protein
MVEGGSSNLQLPGLDRFIHRLAARMDGEFAVDRFDMVADGQR